MRRTGDTSVGAVKLWRTRRTDNQDVLHGDNGTFHVVQNGRIVVVDFNAEHPGTSVLPV